MSIRQEAEAAGFHVLDAWSYPEARKLALKGCEQIRRESPDLWRAYRAEAFEMRAQLREDLADVDQAVLERVVLTHARMRTLLSRTRQQDLLGESFADEVLLHHLPMPYIFDGRMRQPDYAAEHRRRRAAGLDPYIRIAPDWPLPNVHLGVSVEDQQWADIRIPALLATPAAVRWISAEPLLGPIDLGSVPPRGGGVPALDWVVAGGESGPGARPMRTEWARALRDQCAEAEVPFLFKQWGAHDEHGRRGSKKTNGRLLDGVQHDGYPAGVS